MSLQSLLEPWCNLINIYLQLYHAQGRFSDKHTDLCRIFLYTDLFQNSLLSFKNILVYSGPFWAVSLITFSLGLSLCRLQMYWFVGPKYKLILITPGSNTYNMKYCYHFKGGQWQTMSLTGLQTAVYICYRNMMKTKDHYDEATWLIMWSWSYLIHKKWYNPKLKLLCKGQILFHALASKWCFGV